MNYKIVGDETQIKTFYTVFQQQICAGALIDRCHLALHLQSRRKYNTTEHGQSRSTIMLLRQHFALIADADAFVRRVRSLEIGGGLYVDYSKDCASGTALPSEALVLYTSVNALDRVAATQKLISDMVNRYLLALPTESEKFPYIDKEFVTQLHNSPCTKVQFVDVDTQNTDFLVKLDTLLIEQRAHVYFVTKTKNGFHYVLQRGPVMRDLTSFCAQNAKDESGAEQISMQRNGMIALPGTFQGGTLVQLLYARGSSVYTKYASGASPQT